MRVAGLKPGSRCEALAGIGLVSGSLLLFLVLDGLWSAPILALEGAMVFWAGVVLKWVLVRHLGLLLQLAAGFIFADSVWYPLSAAPLVNYYFLGCLSLSLAALSSSYFLDKYRGQLQRWEKYYSRPVMILGLVWWYIGGLREVDRQISHSEMMNGLLMFCCASSIIAGLVTKRISWPRFRASMYLQLPAMVLLAAMNLAGFFFGHLLAGWGAVTWTAALAVQYRILSHYAGDWPRRWMYGWYLGTIMLLLFILYHETLLFWVQATTLEKLSFSVVLVLWSGLLYCLIRNLLREMKVDGEKKSV